MFAIWASLKTQCKNIYCSFGISFPSCFLFLSSSSLTYLESQPEKVSAKLLFPPEQTHNMTVFLGYNLT